VDLLVSSSGFAIRNTLEFLLSLTRDAPAAKRFFAKALGARHSVVPPVITVDKNAAYPKAFKELQVEGILPEGCELRQSKYLNNLIEQDHRAHQTTCQTRIGFLFVRDGGANAARI